MSEAVTGIVILIGLSLVCAVTANVAIRRPMIAAIIAVPVASLLLQIANSVHLGYVDPFAPFAFAFCAFWAFLIALLVDLLFWAGRRRAG